MNSLFDTNDGFSHSLVGWAGEYGDELAEVLEEIEQARKHSRSREIDFFGEDA